MTTTATPQTILLKPVAVQQSTSHRGPPPSAKGDFVCTYCGKHFSHKHNLNEHTLRVHLNVASVCKYCGKSYRSLSVFIKHIKGVHNHDGPYVTACTSKVPAHHSRLAKQ